MHHSIQVQSSPFLNRIPRWPDRREKQEKHFDGFDESFRRLLRAHARERDVERVIRRGVTVDVNGGGAGPGGGRLEFHGESSGSTGSQRSDSELRVGEIRRVSAVLGHCQPGEIRRASVGDGEIPRCAGHAHLHRTEALLRSA